MNNTTRIRIREHRRMFARDLVAHPLNPRIHTDFQRSALKGILHEIGFARSLLAFELPDGKLQLIDGHLRRELLDDQEVIVEILDVTPAEANALLLTLDPLACLARQDANTLDQLRQLATTSSEAVHELWNTIGQAAKETNKALKTTGEKLESLPRQFLVLVTCETEEQQSELLSDLQSRGLHCKSLIS